MMGLLGLMFGMAPITVVQHPQAAVVNFQIVVRATSEVRDGFDTRRALAEAMARQTDDYGPAAIQRILLGSGDSSTVSVGPSAFRIGFSVPNQDWMLGISLAASMLRSPRLVGGPSRANRIPSSWQFGLLSGQAEGAVRDQDLPALFQRWIQPENVFVAVVGDVDPTLIERAWLKRMADWKGTRTRIELPLRASRLAPPSVPSLRSARIFRLSAEGNDSEIPELALATVALGVGKTSTAFRVLRVQRHDSYRQECVLLPARRGWQVTVQWAQSSNPNLQEVKSDLLRDVDRWDGETLRRSKALCRSVLERGLRWPFIWLDSETPVDRSLASEGYFAAIWQSRYGESFDLDKFLASIDSVSLDGLKAIARRIANS